MPSGSWNSYVNRTNAPFTLTGLSASQYQLEVILVKADGTNCAPVYKTFTLVGDYDCTKITFNGQIVKPTAATQEMHISYTKLSGYADPSCGWRVVYIQNGNTYTYIPTLTGTSGTIKISLGSTNGLVLYMEADLCNGKTKRCHVQDVLYSAPPCTPIVFTDKLLQATPPNGMISLFFNQSIPATTNLKITYQQYPPVVTGCPLDSLTTPMVVPLATSTTFVSFPIHPCAAQSYIYKVWVQDDCGQTHVISFP